MSPERKPDENVEVMVRGKMSVVVSRRLLAYQMKEESQKSRMAGLRPGELRHDHMADQPMSADLRAVEAAVFDYWAQDLRAG